MHIKVTIKLKRKKNVQHHAWICLYFEMKSHYMTIDDGMELYVDQVAFRLRRDPPAFASLILELKVCMTTPSHTWVLCVCTKDRTQVFTLVHQHFNN